MKKNLYKTLRNQTFKIKTKNFKDLSLPSSKSVNKLNSSNRKKQEMRELAMRNENAQSGVS